MINKNISILDCSFESLRYKFQKCQSALKLLGTENRSIMANRNISQNQEILQIPFDECINHKMESIQKSPLVKYMQHLQYYSKSLQPFFTAPQFQKVKQMMAIIKEIERKIKNIISLIEIKYIDEIYSYSASHRLYIATLPLNYDYHPLNFVENIRPFHEKIAERLSNFIKNRQIIKYVFRFLVSQKFHNTSFERFLTNMGKQNLYNRYKAYFQDEKCINYHYMVCITRSFQDQTLVPLLDFFNHSIQFNAQWEIVKSKQIIILKASSDIKQKEEVFVNYGQKSIQDLFTIYGFYDESANCELIINVKIALCQTYDYKWDTQHTHDCFQNYKKYIWQITKSPQNYHKYTKNFLEFCKNTKLSMMNKQVNLKILLEMEKMEWKKYEVLGSVNKIIEKEIKLFDEIIALFGKT